MPHFGYYTVDIFDCPPFEMFSNNDDPRTDNIMVAKRFEPQSMRLWCKFARSATSILDIGSHTGVYALSAAALRKDIPIHAFEANPYTAARLRVNKFKNGFEHLQDHFVALSDETTATTVHWSVKPGGRLSSGAGLQTELRDGWETAAVFSYPVDSLKIPPGNRSLVKIDVEGAEVLVLRGMQAFLTAQPLILLETLHPEKAKAISAMISGYRFFRIIEDGGVIETPTLTAGSPESTDFNQLLLPAWAPAPD